MKVQIFLSRSFAILCEWVPVSLSIQTHSSFNSASDVCQEVAVGNIALCPKQVVTLDDRSNAQVFVDTVQSLILQSGKSNKSVSPPHPPPPPPNVVSKH